MIGSARASSAKLSGRPAPERCFALAAALFVAFALTLSASAEALKLDPLEPEWPAGVPPFAIAAGPEGNIWFTELISAKIGRVTPAGEVTEYSGLSSAARGITEGPEGNIWFAETTANKIGYIKPSEPEAGITEFSTGVLQPTLIVTGSDDSLWFTAPAQDKIARIAPGGVITEFPLPSAANVCSITTVPDGTGWFGDCGTEPAVGRISPAGSIIEFPVESPPSSIASWDGKVVFTQDGGQRIASITTSGVVTTHPSLAPSNLRSLTPSPDGNLWAADTYSQNEKHAIEVKAASGLGGTFRLCGEGSCSVAIAYNASAATIHAVLEAFYGPTVSVTRASGEGFVRWTAEFSGKLSQTDVPMLKCANELTGVEPSCTVTTIQEVVPNGLMRMTPEGKVTEFELGIPGLAPSTTNSLAFGTDDELSFAVGTPDPRIGRFDIPAPLIELAVATEGEGTVTSSSGQISCPPFCSDEFNPGADVTLVATPKPGWVFVSWKGCDQGGTNGRECLVTMSSDRTVSAKFVRTPTLTVSKTEGAGLGKVTSYPAGVLCLAACTETSVIFKEGAAVKLNQAASKNHHFVQWTGDCTGSGVCEVTMGEDHDVGVEFAENTKYSLSLTKTGGGQGTVKSSPAGFNCGIACGSQTVDFYDSTVVVLTAVVQAGKGSTFAGWSGAGCSGTGTCTVTMDQANSVEAEFE